MSPFLNTRTAWVARICNDDYNRAAREQRTLYPRHVALLLFNHVIKAGGRPLLVLFHSDRNGGVCRKPNLLPLNIGDQAQIDEMMVAFVAAHPAILFGQLDTIAVHSINRSDMDTVRADDFHMLFDFARVRHGLSFLYSERQRTDGTLVH